MAKKVLVIDDDADILELLIYNLEKEGYEVKSAANGLEGIEAAKQFMPDLILMDIMMPIMDGIEAGKIIKKTEKLKHIHQTQLRLYNGTRHHLCSLLNGYNTRWTSAPGH